jgi:hypothetical protein
VPLTAQQRQGLHGEGFVFALASAAGLIASKPVLDVDGVDWEIGHPGPVGSSRSPKIDLQVKTWRDPRRDGDVWQYRMPVSQFNALAGTGFTVPRYLVLVTVPPEPEEYAACSASTMQLRQAAYWTSLADRDLLPSEPVRRVGVNVPIRNLLTAETLFQLVCGRTTGTSS